MLAIDSDVKDGRLVHCIRRARDGRRTDCQDAEAFAREFARRYQVAVERNLDMSEEQVQVLVLSQWFDEGGRTPRRESPEPEDEPEPSGDWHRDAARRNLAHASRLLEGEGAICDAALFDIFSAMLGVQRAVIRIANRQAGRA